MLKYTIREGGILFAVLKATEYTAAFGVMLAFGEISKSSSYSD